MDKWRHRWNQGVVLGEVSVAAVGVTHGCKCPASCVGERDNS